MFEKLKAWVSAKAQGDGASPAKGDAEAKRQAAAWFLALVKTGEKWNTDEWKGSTEAYEGETEPGERERANLWRTTVDTQAAFLAQDPKSPRCHPQEGYEEDPQAVGSAKCDQAVYNYVFREMAYALVMDKMRHAAGLVDMGVVVHSWDLRKGLPTIRHIEAEDVRIDGDCGGNLIQAGWVAFAEYVSAEHLSRLTKIPLAKLQRAARGQGDPDVLSGESNDERRKALRAVGDTLAKCKVWHVYCRNEFALYDQQPEAAETDKSEGKPHFERFRDAEGLTEPRRYVKVVEGLDEPLEDQRNGWPKALALDYDQWVLTVLSFNQAKGKVGGFTDWRHVSVLQDDFNTTLMDLNTRTRLRNPPKILKGVGCTLADNEIRRYMESKQVEVIPDAVTSDGKPQLIPMDFGTPTTQEIELLGMLKNLFDQMSMIPEIMRGGNEGFDTAMEASTARDAAMAKTERRFKLYEHAQTEIARKTLQLCHANLPALTRIEVLEPETAEELQFDSGAGEIVPVTVETGNFVPTMVDLPWAEARARLREPGSELIQLGVEAMVGPKLAAFWEEGASPDVVRASTRVDVEGGSSQRQVRADRAKEFRDLVMQVLLPVAQATSNPRMAVALARRALELMDIENVDALVPTEAEVQQATAMAQMPQGAPGEPAAPASAPAEAT